MKADTPNGPRLVPDEERGILDSIRKDRELIARLKITPEELDALSKCALFGTLTSKQHMLFILRQIREAGGPELASVVPDQAPLFPEPALPEEEDPVPSNWRRVMPRLAPNEIPSHRAASRPYRAFFWSTILIVGLVLAIVSWQAGFLAGIGLPANPLALGGDVDRPYKLLWIEALLIVAIAGVVFLKTHENRRRFKVRPRRARR